MSRLRGTGGLAACVLAGAWLVGSTALALMGVGLALAAVAVGAWRRLVVQGMSVERRPLDGEDLAILPHEPADERRSDHPPMAGDEDPFAGELEDGLGLSRRGHCGSPP